MPRFEELPEPMVLPAVAQPVEKLDITSVQIRMEADGWIADVVVLACGPNQKALGQVELGLLHEGRRVASAVTDEWGEARVVSPVLAFPATKPEAVQLAVRVKGTTVTATCPPLEALVVLVAQRKAAKLAAEQEAAAEAAARVAAEADRVRLAANEEARRVVEEEARAAAARARQAAAKRAAKEKTEREEAEKAAQRQAAAEREAAELAERETARVAAEKEARVKAQKQADAAYYAADKAKRLAQFKKDCLPFEVSDDGKTAFDPRSRLTWQRGMVQCNDHGIDSYDKALAYAAALNLNGNGWRLPTKAEVRSVCVRQDLVWWFHGYVFLPPNEQSAHDSRNFWQQRTDDGLLWRILHGHAYYLRCVRNA